ncbi:LOW QUALITY PROTEIN: uncharacterized protein LOC108094797 [Drosophila ficusphila]|uniref:LOW QUALITY PROTEIN: uncharacterized protein LOC108094797 n=1 Tax=Drosophila ficusphila TaxID=30025 RepID=UPI001C897E2B|nr:LOW QUALITY PROTEIN: uncharacterized protein LOC108094797 [Drosophila ficusphila]
MKFYPNADVWFCVDKPSCMNSYQKYPPNHSWKLQDKTIQREIYYWRDLEGVKKTQIKLKDLYFTKWPKSRIRPQACLGMLYATGNRFIRLTQAPPAGFKCAPMPVNLATAQMVKVELRKKAKRDRAAARKAKRDAKKAKKAAKKEKRQGGKGGKDDLKPKVIRTYEDAEKAK